MVVGAIFRGVNALIYPLIQPLFVPLLYWTLTSLGTIMSVWTNGDRIQDENDFINPLQPSTYDFIIVGAGSAGCLLANRLSKRHSVLLIEAGGEPNPLQFVPGFSLFFTNFPELDWQHRTVPQRFGSLISVNGESSWSTGKGLGGTGMLNYMIHLRGHQRDFDNWANITGDPSWSWEGVLPYFKRYEDYEIPGDSVNHGYGGDLRIEAPDHPQSAYEFVRAGGELGYPNVDLNAPFSEGFDVVRFPILRGIRQAPYKGLLEPVRNRPTLTIMKFAQVNKILFRDGNLAYGVEYDRHGKTYVANAAREVIVSAGSVGSPKLLMLSGVGPSFHLQDLNIPVVADLPVGQNLQDHLGVYLGPFHIRSGLGYFLDRDLTIGEFIKWFTLGRGRLSNSGCEGAGLFSSSINKARGEGNWPDILLFSYGFTTFRDGPENFARIFNLKLDDIQRYLINDVGRDSLFQVVTGARPFSRGSIQLGGQSPYDKLIIDPNYLGDEGETDLKVLLEGVKRTVILMENTTAGGVNLGARFTSTRFPGCENLEFRSDAYWICYIRRYSVTLHHPVGTCSMGSVVDSELRVVGTRNLRVIDASIQPVIVLTNTQASTLMIAEKGADMILKFWNGQLKNINQVRNKKKSFFGLGGGNYKRENELWLGNKRREKILEGPVGGIILQQEYDGEYGPSYQLYSRHQVPIYEHAEADMVGNFKQSFQHLKMVTQLANQNYNNSLLEQEVPMITKAIKSKPIKKHVLRRPNPSRDIVSQQHDDIKYEQMQQYEYQFTSKQPSSENEVDDYYDDERYPQRIYDIKYEEDSQQIRSSSPLTPTYLREKGGDYIEGLPRSVPGPALPPPPPTRPIRTSRS